MRTEPTRTPAPRRLVSDAAITRNEFSDSRKVCEHYFGRPRQSGISHMVFRTPWRGDPRVNIQSDRGKAKAYQVRQVLTAIDRVEEDSDDGTN